MPSISHAEWLHWPQTRAVFAALSPEGVATRAVGGAVRDALIGRAAREVDLATTAPPKQVMALAARAGLKAIPTGIDHGTVTVVADGTRFEVTTLRRDVETFGRHARVAFTDDWAQDAGRRDFTINALYAGVDGEVFDPLGGMADIEARRVRFIGDPVARIREDYLRILRFFRFSADYGRPPYDAAALAACTRERAGMSRLSPERVRAEILRLLGLGGAGAALWAMFDHGLLVDVLGGVPYLTRFERLAAIESAIGAGADGVLRLAALAVAVEEDAERLRARLRLSNIEQARLSVAARPRSIAPDADGRAARVALYRLGPDRYRDIALIAWAEARAGAEDARWRALLDLPERWTPPGFPIGGEDLLRLGIGKGPPVGEILRRLEADWIAGGFAASRADLIEAARKLAGRGGGSSG